MSKHDLYTQLALFFQNPMIRETSLESIVSHLEEKLDTYPKVSEAVAIAINSIKSRIKDYKKLDPAKNGYLRKLCLILAQSYVKLASKEDLEESTNFVIKTLTNVENN